MSWDYKHVPAPVNRAAECRALVSDDYKVLKDALVGTTWYAAVQNKTTGEVRALIVLIHIDRKDHCNFGVNWMNELDGPYYYDCPKSILDLLTPTDNTLALEWRRKCRERLKMKETLKKAPYGTRFIVTLYDGSTRTVIKRKPGYQFKTWWLLIEAECKYLPKNRITAAQPA
ncbi:MAG: hypothetical protein IJ584_13880 [Bacteroidales bacterium]|nr:hypothetical protein [Bacteroidales bacterium]